MKSNLVKNVNRYLRRLARGRKVNIVTADDIHTFARKNNLRLTRRQYLSLASRVLRQYTSMGTTTASNRPEARYRQINEWMTR